MTPRQPCPLGNPWCHRHSWSNIWLWEVASRKQESRSCHKHDKGKPHAATAVKRPPTTRRHRKPPPTLGCFKTSPPKTTTHAHRASHYLVKQHRLHMDATTPDASMGRPSTRCANITAAMRRRESEARCHSLPEHSASISRLSKDLFQRPHDSNGPKQSTTASAHREARINCVHGACAAYVRHEMHCATQERTTFSRRAGEDFEAHALQLLEPHTEKSTAMRQAKPLERGQSHPHLSWQEAVGTIKVSKKLHSAFRRTWL